MDLNPAQRKAAFAVIVLALVGLGVFLLFSGRPAAQTAGTPPHSSDHRPAAQQSANIPPTQPAGGQGGVNIYQWLPFSQAGLSAAASTVRAFLGDYATYTYSESAQAYVARMRSLITPELAATLTRGYATPGVAQLRTQQKQSASGHGVITALRTFGPSSLTFVAAVTQQTTGTQGRAQQTTDYAVTVAGAGDTWQVADIELASAGNA
ncbi:MAG TPA: hypothetical protein VGS19_26345 [Streptosporangiaceae bacterium]|nr:hypothetical protein [Streptosporangiaceae bacterium]